MTENNHIPVFYEGQDDLIEILATSMASVCYTTKSFIDFYILDCGICDFNKRQLEGMKEKFNNFSLEFIPIDLKQFEGLKGYTANNYVDCYSRLLIPELKPDLDKAIYLDSDTIALKDIQFLWDENIYNKSLGAVADLGYRQSTKDYFVNVLGGNPKQIFLSGGLFVVDCKKWRKNKTTECLLNLAKEKGNNLNLIIEDLFSLYFVGDFCLLDSRYGFIEIDNFTDDIPCERITKKYLENELNNVSILHFAGDNKVWKNALNKFTGKFHSQFSNFWKFAAMTPYYDGLQNKYIWYCAETFRYPLPTTVAAKKTEYRLFNLFPLFKTVVKRSRWIKLFGFIPFIKIKEK